MKYDDGFVAYLWADSLNAPVEIARANAPGATRMLPINPLAFNATATANHDDSEAVKPISFDVSHAARYLRVGTNYLVIQGLNSSTSSSDFLIDPELVAKSVSVELPDGVFQYAEPIAVDHNVRNQGEVVEQRESHMVWPGE